MSVRRAAVVRMGGLGDNLIATSVIYPLSLDYAVDVITNEEHGVVFDNNPWVDRIIKVRKGDIPEGGDLEWQMWHERRSHEYDRYVHLSHSVETTLALLPSQTQFWWGEAARRKLCGHSYLERAHDIAGVPHCFDPGPRFYPTAEEVEKALANKDMAGPRVIGWVIGGSRIDKVYPQSSMVIARLLRETGLPVMMFGAPGKDFEMAKQVLDQVVLLNGNHDGLHLCMSDNMEKPNWPMRRSLTQVQQCDVVVSPDTGLAWAVAMEAMPKVILLSHASPENITKHWRNTNSLHADPEKVSCSPCHRLHSDYSTCRPNASDTGAACISDIDTETVVASVKAALSAIDITNGRSERYAPKATTHLERV